MKNILIILCILTALFLIGVFQELDSKINLQQAQVSLTNAQADKASAEARKARAEASRIEAELDRDKAGWTYVAMKDGMIGVIVFCIIGSLVLFIAVSAIALFGGTTRHKSFT